nr:hypothetical protein [Chromohalobacter japonicus]
MKGFDNCRANQNERPTHYQGTQNAPEEHTVLILRGNREVGEDQHKDKNIIDTEALFNQASCKELISLRFSHEDKHAGGEYHCQHDIAEAEPQGMLDGYLLFSSMYNTEVQGKQRNDKQVEPDPHPYCVHSLPYLHLLAKFSDLGILVKRWVLGLPY